VPRAATPAQDGQPAVVAGDGGRPPVLPLEAAPPASPDARGGGHGAGGAARRPPPGDRGRAGARAARARGHHAAAPPLPGDDAAALLGAPAAELRRGGATPRTGHGVDRVHPRTVSPAAPEGARGAGLLRWRRTAGTTPSST